MNYKLASEQVLAAKDYISKRNHGDVVLGLERHLGLPPRSMLDLSASMNPVAPDVTSLYLESVNSLSSYPDETHATLALAQVLNVDDGQLVLCNGGSEAISLVAGLGRSGYVVEPEFSLYSRHISNYRDGTDWWASNPNNPIGRLLDQSQRPEVVDEAFYQIATGTWTRRDFEHGSYVIGSLTKLFALPGLRLGYIVAPSIAKAIELKKLQPQWAVNALALGMLPTLLQLIDLSQVQSQVASLRNDLNDILIRYGAKPEDSDANYIFIADGLDIFDRFLSNKIVARDTSSFGLTRGIRIAVPSITGLERVEAALFPSSAKKRSRYQGSLMVVGTTSDSGKSTIVTALCRILSDRGVAVAPFKAQNMSLNSAVTASGHEIGRAQARQAAAARIDPRVEMNPLLLKPTSQMTTQVVLMGKPIYEITAKEFQSKKTDFLDVIVAAYKELASSCDVVLLEGAGSPAEINLLANDVVNLKLANTLGAKAVLVGDIDRGGVFASLYGTVKILPSDLSNLIQGFIINKIRGDRGILESGLRQLESLTGRKVFGVLPYLERAFIDGEDSLSFFEFGRYQANDDGVLDIAVIAVPHISNFTDFDPLLLERKCSVRIVRTPGALGDPDLIILPGSKSTVEDLNWLHSSELSQAISKSVSNGSFLLGICAGFQMLGVSIEDDVESRCGRLSGLGFLEVSTKFENSKVTRLRKGFSGFFNGIQCQGYQIHHGRVSGTSERHLFELASEFDSGLNETEGAVDSSGRIFGSSLHGMFDSDSFRAEFLGYVALARSKIFESVISFEKYREDEIDYLADVVSQNLDVDQLLRSTSIFK